MKILSVFLLALLCCPGIRSQNISASPDQPNSSFVQMNDLNGKPIPSADRLGIEGTPMLFQSWSIGTVQFKGGKQASGLELEYSLVNDELHFKREGAAYLFADTVAAFTILNNSSDSVEKVSFRRIFHDPEEKSDARFFQVMEDGKNIQVLRHLAKKVEEEYVYNLPPRKFYALSEEWWILDVKKKKLFKVNNKKKSLLEALPDYARSINELATNKSKNSYSNDELIVIARSLNSL
ncbi:MAG: hypothetical protein ACHQET_04500 [Chitinophagales bacterium]